MGHLKKLLGIVLMIAILVTIGGCLEGTAGSGSYQTSQPFDPEQKIAASKFASLNEYTQFVKRYQNGEGSITYYGSARVVTMGSAVTVTGAPFTMSPSEAPVGTSVTVPAAIDAEGHIEAVGPSGPAGATGNYSQTNVQVAGVDEADILKTDGNYIYTITENTLFIIKAYPGEEAKVVSRIRFDNNSPTSLFVNGDHLAIFGNFYDDALFNRIGFRPQSGMTFFNIYDISDRSDPVLVKEYRFEGNYSNARMLDQWVYCVVGNGLVYRADYPTPIIMDGTVLKSMPVTDIYRFDIPYRYPELVTVHAVNITSPAEAVKSTSVAVESGQNLYMSEKNMFLTYTEYIDESQLQNEILKDILESQLATADRELIAKIKATDDDVLSQYEKETKIMDIYWSYLDYMPQDDQDALWDQVQEQLEIKLKDFYYEYTVINKIGVNGGDIKVLANGKVPGHIINQFSLDENIESQVLRIATTVSSRWSRFGAWQSESANNVYALDSSMNVIGELEGLAKGEQIYSTRFMGDKLYMVTFRQVDPFFVIDLSNPRDIRELGQLKIPGFSRYLHPYDEDTIIGIGQNTNSSGSTTGLKISLFDVSDFDNPREIAKYVTSDRYVESTAIYEHKAFLFSKEKNLLVIPVSSYGWSDWRGRTRDAYNGVFVFKITKTEIELRDLIDHSEGLWEDDYYAPQVERSLYINDLLYTKSPYLLKINALGDLSLVKDVKLRVY